MMTTIDDRVWAGVDALLDDYTKVGSDDYVLVAYTPESRDPAAWIATSLKMRAIESTAIAMRPLKDDTFAGRLNELLPAPDSLRGKLIVITVERDTMSHSGLFRQALSGYDKSQWLAARIISASAEFFTHGMNARTADLSALNTALLKRFMPARELRITTPGGTDLRVTLDSERYRWLSNRGCYRPGRVIILPAGEVATHATSVNGVLVADGAFNVNVYTKLDARLGTHPVQVRIEDGKAVDFHCADPNVRELVSQCLARPNATNVGEVGFGTNRGVGEFISMNSHINERRPGVHIGFGQHNQSDYVVDYHCDVHLDLIAVGGSVWVENDPTPIDLQRVHPSFAAHPTVVMDEDLDGDCCGQWLDELRVDCRLGSGLGNRAQSEYSQ